MTETEFMPGIQLNERYYWQAVRPILLRHFPALAHSAALVGYGSDVLGLDTEVSRDHMWGPRLVLFLPPENFQHTSQAIYGQLRAELPPRFLGYSTHFSRPDPGDNGTRVRENRPEGPVEPLIFFHTLESFFQQELGCKPDHAPTPVEWLTFSDQQLLGVTAGKVYHDDLGLEQARARFAYYPQDVWLYQLAAQWSLISQEEAFVGRAASVQDDLGSRLIAARLVQRLMRLCFLMERRYAPYSKWFGSAFQRLNCAPRMQPYLEGALAASAFAARDRNLAQAYTLAAEMHNALGLTPPLETRTRTYSAWHALRAGIPDLPLADPANTRPYQTIFAGRFVEAIQAAIQDPAVLALRRWLGSTSQFLVESSDALQNKAFRRGLTDDLQIS